MIPDYPSWYAQTKRKRSSSTSTSKADPPRPTTAAPLLVVPVGSVVVNAIEVCATLEPGTVAVAPDPAELMIAELITELTDVLITSAPHGVRSTVSPPRVLEYKIGLAVLK